MMHLSSDHHTMPPYQACQELFVRYPLAARAVHHMGTVHSMVLMLRDGDELRFFVLSQDCENGMFVYTLSPWPIGGAVEIVPYADVSIPEFAGKALADSVPLPRHGSIFGWIGGDAITALIVIYAEYEHARPLPRWTVMPLAGIPQPQWPSFIGKRLFGYWFWEHYEDRSVVPLDRLIADTPDTVFWVDTRGILGSDCCAVARDISSPDGHTLRRGRYVYSEVLRAGGPLPSLTALLADPGKTDLAPRFRRSATATASFEAGTSADLQAMYPSGP